MASEPERNSDLEIPLGIDYKKWQFLVKALLKMNADKSPVTADAASQFTSIALSKVRSNVPFMRILGVVTRDSKPKSITLTDEGAKYASALFLPDPAAEKILMTKFAESGLKELIDFCNLHSSAGDLSFDKLFNQIKLLSRTNDMTGAKRNTHPDYRVGIYTIIEILIASGFLSETYIPAKNEEEAKTEKTSNIANMVNSKKSFDIPVNMQRDWMINLFKAITNNTVQKIDKNFITGNVNRHHHEGTIQSFAKFLGLVDENGNLGENFEKLRIYSTSEFAPNLAEVIRTKYAKIFTTINIETVERDNLEILIMREYGMNKPQAERAVNTIIYLCELAQIEVSESLVQRKPVTEKPLTTTSSKKSDVVAQAPKIEPQPIQHIPSQNVHYKETSHGIEIKIEIEIDAKDENAFSNTLKFIKELKIISDVSEATVELSSKSN